MMDEQAAARHRICLKNCPRRGPHVGLSIVCLEDNRETMEHAIENSCPLGKFNAPAKSLPDTIMHGMAGIARAVTGTGGASAELIEQRTAICRACPHAKLSAGLLERCDLCGCSTWAKVRNAGESCPIGKWTATAPA